jgi:predicted MFS family arabinose efflux permease
MGRTSYFAVLAAAVACYAALGAVLAILPDLVDDRAALGLAVGAPALAAVITRPAGGRLADRIGPGPVVTGGAIVMALGIAPAWVDGYGALLASRLLIGAGEGAMMSAAVLWLLRLAGPDKRGQALGHIGLANYAGLTAGPLLASALGHARDPVLVAAAALPLLGVALAARAERPPAERSRQAQGTGVFRATLGPGISLALVNCGYVALLAFGAQVTGSRLIVPVFAAGVILARTAGASIPDRAGARPTVLVSTVVAAAGLFAVTAGAGLPGTALLAAGQGLAVPALGLLALRRVAPERHGAAAGLFFAYFDAGVGGGGLLVGLVARATSPAEALTMAGGAVLAAGLLQVRTPSSKIEPQPVRGAADTANGAPYGHGIRKRAQ